MDKSTNGPRDNCLSSKIDSILKNLSIGSPFFENRTTKTYPSFSQQEITLGKTLGVGEFGIVQEIREFLIPEKCTSCAIHRCMYLSSSENDEDNIAIEVEPTGKTSTKVIESLTPDDMKTKDEVIEFTENRGFMKDHCIRQGAARYAIKTLKLDLSPKCIPGALLDLAIESKFLEVLSHPNIIKMRGMGIDPGQLDFYIILDRLYCTLSEKRDFWYKEKKTLSRGLIVGKENKTKLKHIFRDRLIAMYDVARAMKYIHDYNVLYRDLKPENIGFDVRGNAKIFDFGLVKELLPSAMVAPGLFKATGLTGSRRYMAPEVLLCKYYGLTADVYSFSILFWEILALKTPFETYDCDDHANLVIRGGKRPKIPTSWPVWSKEILQEGWDSRPLVRPDFTRMCEILHGELILWTEGKIGNRSSHLMNQSNSSRRC